MRLVSREILAAVALTLAAAIALIIALHTDPRQTASVTVKPMLVPQKLTN
jgi:hypothetical protein